MAHAHSAPRYAHRGFGVRRQHGTLQIELILSIGVVVAVSSGIFALATRVDRARQVDRQAKDFHALVEAIDAANGRSTGHFTGVSATSVADDALVPAGMIEGTRLRSAWGPITIAPVTLDARRPNAYVRLSYVAVPAAFCFPFISAIHRGEAAVHVGGLQVADPAGGLNLPRLAEACRAAPALVVIDHDGGGSGDRSLP